LSIDVKSRTIRGLDGLRGLAACAVFLVHYQQIVDFDFKIGPLDSYQLFPNGKYGVALFFILSGLLLSLPFWQSLSCSTPWPKMKRYIVRRSARILPAYYLALTVLILINGLWRAPEGWIDIALHYSFLFNFSEFSIFSINAPFWTLAVEMQFYFILPLLFLFARQMSPWQVFSGLLLLGLLVYSLHYWVVSTTTRTILWPGSDTLMWIRPYGAVLTHSLLAHLPIFLLGVAGGWLFIWLDRCPEHYADSRCRWSDACFWSCLLLLLGLLGTEAGDRVQVPYGQYGLPLIPLLLTLLVLCAPFTRFANKILDSTLLRRLGILSYGIYIYHLPCLYFVDSAMLSYGWNAPEHWLVLGSTSILLTIMIASISYLAVERPVLRWVKSSHW
jgi:peptidoglycan/LPS O-acetylase OafA/YrhL